MNTLRIKLAGANNKNVDLKTALIEVRQQLSITRDVTTNSIKSLLGLKAKVTKLYTELTEVIDTAVRDACTAMSDFSPVPVIP